MEKEKKKKSNYNLSKDIIYLLTSEEPFWAAISSQIDKISSTSIPTAGVRVNQETYQFELSYNPEFMENLPKKYRTGVLQHEFYHLVLEHVTSREKVDRKKINEAIKNNNITPDVAEEMKKAKLWNIAWDLAINSHLIGRLPGEKEQKEVGFAACFPGEGDFKKLPPNKASEWYYNEIIKNKKLKEKLEPKFTTLKSGGLEIKDENNFGQFDSHDNWGGCESEEHSEIIREKIRDIVKNAAQHAASYGWGTISKEMKKSIMDSIETKVCWKAVLRYFIQKSQKAPKSSSIKVINKRYPYIHAGKKVKRQANIAISIDQSGSVSDKMLAEFFSELNSLSKLAEFTVIPFDHDVAEDKIYVWKKGKTNLPERVLCGGTDFSAPTKYVNEKRCFDGHIILTDLCAEKPIPSRVQRIWMTTPECAKSPYFQTNEMIIAIE